MRVDALNEYARCFFGPDFEKMDSLTRIAFSESQAIDYKKGYARSLQNLGLIAYYFEENHPKALKLYENSLASYRANGDSSGVANSLGDIGSYYQGEGDYGLALSNYLRALEIVKKEGNIGGISALSSNIGSIFLLTNENQEALFYINKAMQTCDSIRSPINYGNILSNLMSVWINEGNKDSIDHYFSKTVAYQKNLGMLNYLADTYSNMQTFYQSYATPGEKEFDMRKMYVDSAYKYSIIADYTPTLVKAIYHKGLIYKLENQRDSSEKFFNKVIKLSSDVNYESNYLYESYRNLSEIKAQSGFFSEAFELMRRADQLGQRLAQRQSDEALLNVKSQFQIEEVKKELDLARRRQALVQSELSLVQLDNERKDSVARVKQLQIYIILAGLLVVITLTIILFFAYRNKQKANKTISLQKIQVEEKNAEINLQKQIVEEKHRLLESSILYASKIQQAIMPSDAFIKQLIPSSFVWFKSKEAVSGDFYWVKSWKDQILFAVADATGNGVPGALVSLVCSNGLNRATEDASLNWTGELLTKTHEIVAEEFAKNSGHFSDGMDIGLCSIKDNKLFFSGANRPVWICREGELTEIEGAPISINSKSEKRIFSTEEFLLEKGDVIYLFTNGIIDQFGGADGKKLKISNLRRLLLAIYSYEPDKQREMLQKAFKDWRGNMEQIDDICIMGIKIID